MTRRINLIRSTAIRAAASTEYALTEALTEATLTKAEARQYRRSAGDRIAAIVAGLLLGLVSVALALAILSVVFIGAAALAELPCRHCAYGLAEPTCCNPGRPARRRGDAARLIPPAA